MSLRPDSSPSPVSAVMTADLDSPNTMNLEETRAALADLAGRRFGSIPLDRVIDLVLRGTEHADWPVRKAAMEAVLRRLAFAKRDELRVAKAPRSVLGRYQVSRKGASRKQSRSPYQVEVLSLDPLRVSCDCPDFARSSLGVCKHGLTVLAKLKPRAYTSAKIQVASSTVLVWDPHHPLTGLADRLARLQLSSSSVRLAGFSNGVPVPAQLLDPRKRLTFIERTLRTIDEQRLEVEPAVLRVLNEEGQRARRVAENQRALQRGLSSLSSLKRKLYPYQLQGVEQFLSTGRLLLADDMGLGKTTQAIAACHALFLTKRIERGLLIVPAALKPQWQREWQSTTHVPLVEVVGTPQDRVAIYQRRKPGFLLIGYEQLLRDFAEVQRYAPGIVVLDEAQRIKNWATKSASYVKALTPEFRLVLTGTPMENRLDELASLMDFVDDTAIEPKWRLVPWHTFSVGNAAQGVGGARNLNALRERLAPAFLRRVRKEVLTQLPKRTDTRVPVEMTEPQQVEHDDLNQPIAKLISTAARRPLTQAEFLRLMSLLTVQRMICNGLAQTNFKHEWPRCQQAITPTEQHLQSLFTPKLFALRALVEQVVVGQRRKAVIFSQWRNMLRLAEWGVRDLLQGAGLRAGFFTGAESQKQRERSLIDFHDEPSAAVLFLSDAGGVGLNLQKAASCCINLELPWNPAVLEQRIGRIYRLGQSRPIDVYNLISEQGIEARIATLVANKKAVFSTLFDGTSDEVHFDDKGTFLEGVKKLVDVTALTAPAATDQLDEQELDVAEEPAVEAPTEEPPSPSVPPESAQPTPSTTQGLSITRLDDGGLRIDAPPALAAPLADLLESLARGLRATTPS